jgi:adenosine kinase
VKEEEMPGTGNILVCGSIAYDTILDFPDRFARHILPDKLHILNVSFTADTMHRNFGGTGGNIAYNLTLLGLKPTLLATVGNDFGVYRRWLEENGIDLAGIHEFPDAFTASATIITDTDDNQITAFHGGAMLLNDVPGGELIDPARFALAIISPDGAGGMQRRARECREAGLPFVIDPGQSLPAHDGPRLREMIRGARALIVNDYELQLVCEKTGLSEDDLLGLTPLIAVTLGREGARLRSPREQVAVGIAPTDRLLDPTGAGDAYRAGFLLGLVNGLDLEGIGRLGAATAVWALEEYGTQNHTYGRGEFIERYERDFGPWPLA